LNNQDHKKRLKIVRKTIIRYIVAHGLRNVILIITAFLLLFVKELRRSIVNLTNCK